MKKIILAILVICVLLFVLRMTLINMLETNDNTNRYFSRTIHSVEDGLDIANKRAKEWNRDAILSEVIVKYDDFNKFKTNTGIISYVYFIDMKGILKLTGYRNAVCIVKIDMSKRSIIQFQSYGGNNLLLLGKLSTNKWKIDLSQIIKQVLEHEQDDYGKVVINRNLFWMVSLFSKDDKSILKTYKIDSLSGDILDVFEKR